MGFHSSRIEFEEAIEKAKRGHWECDWEYDIDDLLQGWEAAWNAERLDLVVKRAKGPEKTQERSI